MAFMSSEKSPTFRFHRGGTAVDLYNLSEVFGGQVLTQPRPGGMLRVARLFGEAHTKKLSQLTSEFVLLAPESCRSSSSPIRPGPVGDQSRGEQRPERAEAVESEQDID
jgi:hypothetical protein